MSGIRVGGVKMGGASPPPQLASYRQRAQPTFFSRARFFRNHIKSRERSEKRGERIMAAAKVRKGRGMDRWRTEVLLEMRLFQTPL